MSEATIECPNCQSVISGPQVIEEMVRCSSCGKWFNPTPEQLSKLLNPTAPEPAPAAVHVAEIEAAEKAQTKAEQVRGTAENFVLGAFFCWLIAGLILGGGFLSTIANSEGSSGVMGWVLPGCGFVSLGLWLYLIGQIIHIRANLEK